MCTYILHLIKQRQTERWKLSEGSVEKSWLRTKKSIHRCVHVQATLKCHI